MPLESASFISQLVATNPAATDLKSEGDDHIRVIKAAVQGSFPSLGATAVTRTATQLNNAADKTGDAYTGAHDFSGATGGLTLASRVRAEYSNATPSSRSLFQSSVTNGQTLVGAMPNGTSAVSGSRYYNASTPDNSGFVGYRVDLTEARIESSKNGTGSFLPLNFYTSDTLRMSIATNGNITFSSPASLPAGSTIVGYAPTASPTFSGTVTVPTPVNASDAANKSYVDGTAFSAALPSQTGNAGKFVTTNGTTASWASIPPQSIVRSARTTNTILGVADSTTLIDYTSGTFTQTITAAATLASGWYCWLRNSGTGVITVDPNGSETIGGAATAALNPGDIWLISSDGTNIQLQRLQGMNQQIYTSGSGNFTVPAGVNRIYVECWGAGGGCTGGNTAGAGGGYSAGWVNTTPAANIAYAVGAGVAGAAGGNTTFGSLTANGGAGSAITNSFGGSATGGTVNLRGGGSYAFNGTMIGGASPNGGTSVTTTTNLGGSVAGNFPGGGACMNTGSTEAGASGQIIIRWV